jgi:hypothetical protein
MSILKYFGKFVLTLVGIVVCVNPLKLENHEIKKTSVPVSQKTLHLHYINQLIDAV